MLDAVCGTGKYFPMVLAAGRLLLGVDHAGAPLAIAAAKFPQVPTERHDLQELPYRGEFDGVLCVDAMEFVPPEEWPPVLERFRRALHSGGWLYLTVERAPADRVRAARAVGGPTTLTAAAADNGVGWNVLSYRPVDSRPTGAVEDIGWTWLGQGRLTAHYFAPHGQQRPA